MRKYIPQEVRSFKRQILPNRMSEQKTSTVDLIKIICYGHLSTVGFLGQEGKCNLSRQHNRKV